MSIGGHDPAVSTPDNYRVFAREAFGRSSHYERLANDVADDTAILAYLAALPPA